jgi:hypothetical protein
MLGGSDRTRTFAWLREGPKPRLVVFNRHPEPQTHLIPLKDVGPGKTFSPSFVSSGELKEVQVTSEGENLRIALPGWTGVLLSAD